MENVYLASPGRGSSIAKFAPRKGYDRFPLEGRGADSFVDSVHHVRDVMSQKQNSTRPQQERPVLRATAPRSPLMTHRTRMSLRIAIPISSTGVLACQR